ncbi:hypothetical protein FNF27_04190 [Cafeteria roenbergensis]|uniref:Uncharacterized protein n=1 Tax=Cafeteria roenbergensis TaxID=33653 RepID=A0A5A8ECB3_CAFRO|nr:hypothetical protein FNF27_04190 [Cafeteria roenbergensis]
MSAINGHSRKRARPEGPESGGADGAGAVEAPRHFAPAQALAGIDVPPGAKVFLVRWTESDADALEGLNGKRVRVPDVGGTSQWASKKASMAAAMAQLSDNDGGASDTLALLPRAGDASGSVQALALDGSITLSTAEEPSAGDDATTSMCVPVDTTTGVVGDGAAAGLALGASGGVRLEASRLNGGVTPVGFPARPRPLAARMAIAPGAAAAPAAPAVAAAASKAKKAAKKAKKAKKATA